MQTFQALFADVNGEVRIFAVMALSLPIAIAEAQAFARERGVLLLALNSPPHHFN